MRGGRASDLRALHVHTSAACHVRASLCACRPRSLKGRHVACCGRRTWYDDGDDTRIADLTHVDQTGMVDTDYTAQQADKLATHAALLAASFDTLLLRLKSSLQDATAVTVEHVLLHDSLAEEVQVRALLRQYSATDPGYITKVLSCGLGQKAWFALGQLCAAQMPVKRLLRRHCQGLC